MTDTYRNPTFDIVAAREAREHRRQARIKKKEELEALIPNTTLWIKRLKIREKTREAMNR